MFKVKSKSQNNNQILIDEKAQLSFLFCLLYLSNNLRTLLQEGLHAYFLHQSLNDSSFRSKYPFLDTNSSGELIYITDDDEREHEYMTKYVNEIAEALKIAYPQLTLHTALALSWGGLQRTRAYKLNKERLDQIVPYNFTNGVIITNEMHRTGGCNNSYIYQFQY